MSRRIQVEIAWLRQIPSEAERLRAAASRLSQFLVSPLQRSMLLMHPSFIRHAVLQAFQARQMRRAKHFHRRSSLCHASMERDGKTAVRPFQPLLSPLSRNGLRPKWPEWPSRLEPVLSSHAKARRSERKADSELSNELRTQRFVAQSFMPSCVNPSD